MRSTEQIADMEVNDKTPLIQSSDNDNKLDVNNLLELSQIERKDTKIKWLLLANLCTIWMATYHCIFSISALQTTLMNDLSLDNTQFALLTSIVFLFAMLSALFTPWIINIIGIYWCLIFASFICIIGQSIFIMGIFFKTQTYLYFGRILIGITLGIDDVAVNTTNSLWFAKSKWVSMAFLLLSQTLEIGSVTARYCIIPLRNIRNSLIDPFILGIALGILSLISSFLMLYLDRIYLKNSDLVQRFKIHGFDMNRIKNMVNFERDFGLIRQFSLKLWLIIIFITLGFSNIETFVSQMTNVFVDKYNMTEWNANLLLSSTTVVGAVLNPFWGWIAFKYSWTLPWFSVLSQIVGIIGFWLFAFVHNDIGLWVGIILFVLSMEWYFSSAFAELYIICPVHLLSVANSINAAMYLFGAVVETYLFGQIADIAGYQWSLIMISISAFIALIISVVKYKI